MGRDRLTPVLDGDDRPQSRMEHGCDLLERVFGITIVQVHDCCHRRVVPDVNPRVAAAGRVAERDLISWV